METVKWERWGSYAIKTTGYSISKSRIRDEWLYTLWKLPKAMLGNYRNVDDAKKAHLEIIRNEPTQLDSVDSKFGLSKTLASDYTRIKG